MEDKNILDKTLITGAEGMVGNYIDFGIRTNHRSLDVTNLDEVMKVCQKHQPKFIVHLAAETDVDRCERDSTHAYMVNAVGSYNMAFAAQAVGAKLIYISTSAVFDGQNIAPYTEEDVPRPQNIYGHSKYLGELAVRGVLEDYLILRICWVFGGGPQRDQKFVAKILNQLGQPNINVVKDKRGSPTYGKDLVDAIKTFIQEDRRGVYHLSNEGAPTRADVVREIIKITNSNSQVTEVEDSFFASTYADRVSNESMVSKTPFMRPWQDALREYILTEWKGTINTAK